MRDRALSMTPADLGLAPSSARLHVFCAVMETGYDVITRLREETGDDS